ncbi:odorant receptor 49b-like [Prorops nasuta]|uniref:odorant receptor 49b-like n=1 Tax=Prorops nasuta TaxID=863751 RepID=UPI0034CEC360
MPEGHHHASFANVSSTLTFILRLTGIVKFKLENAVFWENLLATFAYFCTTIFTTTYVVELIKNVGNSEKIVACIVMSLPGLCSLIRLSMILAYRDRFQRMMEFCEKMWKDANSLEKELIEKYTNITNKLTNWYIYSVILTVMSHFTANLYTNITLSKASMENETYVRILAYESLITTDDKTPYFELLYIFQVIFITNAGITIIGLDLLGPYLILTASGYLKILQSRISNIFHVGRQGTKVITNDNDELISCNSKPPTQIILELKQCILYHQEIFQFCRDIEELANVFFLTVLSTSTYNLSLMGFKLVGNDPDKYEFAAQTTIPIMQLLLCNWPPDILHTQSLAVARAVYDLPWFEQSSIFKKYHYIVLMRSHKPIRLSAGKFVYLSLETFASMLSTAASFFAMISSIQR